MPVKSCKEKGKPGYKWGDSGKCYTYTPGNETSKKAAKAKAIKQGRAIQVNKGDCVRCGLKDKKGYYCTLGKTGIKEYYDLNDDISKQNATIKAYDKGIKVIKKTKKEEKKDNNEQKTEEKVVKSDENPTKNVENVEKTEENCTICSENTEKMEENTQKIPENETKLPISLEKKEFQVGDSVEYKGKPYRIMKILDEKNDK